MNHHPLRGVLVLLPACLVACSGIDPGNDNLVVTNLSNCVAGNTVPISLAVGASQIINASTQGDCLSLPAGTSPQEYVIEAYSGNGIASDDGTAVDYSFQSERTGSATTTATSQESIHQLAAAWHIPGPAAAAHSVTGAQFDRHLRTLERQLSMNPAVRFAHLSTPPAAVPAVGDRDSFNVCTNSDCTTFGRVGATVKYVGAPAIIYLDDRAVAGADPLVTTDFQQLGTIFDQYLYPTDTTAFGRESDINNDGHIAILMTPAVNNLTTDCTNGQVIGYTFSNDLVPFSTGSNAREMFYTIVPSVATASCPAISRAGAIEALQPTLIHELQHMISFNQHSLLRAGFDQELWLNEGLSHFAEELGWRTVPASQCSAFDGGDCFTAFAGGDVSNAFTYLFDTESEFLVSPNVNGADLAQRGASWLFIRWVADHFATDTLLGTDFTRGMEESTTLGAARVAQLAGVDFPTLVGDWHLATWTDGFPGFQTGLLNYRTWNFRATFADNYPQVFPVIYPLIPDSTSTGIYSHIGTLRGGSGRTVRFQLPAGSAGVTIRMAGSLAGDPVAAATLPYFAVVRVQ